jgi:GT2 family glycosyltransferase
MDQAEILIIAVIYNTYPETLRYLESLKSAGADDLSLILADNSNMTKPAGFDEKINDYPFLHYFETGKNLGYFGGASEGLKRYLDQHQKYPAWILVTNVDIVFTPPFFKQLKSKLNLDKLAVIAPAIISNRWNTDYNPKIIERYARSRIQFYQFLYSSFLLHNLFLIAAYSKKWLSGRRNKKNIDGTTKNNVPSKIYGAHGSCLVFHRNYFLQGGNLDLPNFLFGEEIHVAEAARKSGLEVVYDPDLVIYDYEHASTGFFVTPRINRYYSESNNVIFQRYYT